MCKEHMDILKRARVKNVDEMHTKEFIKWFEQRVSVKCYVNLGFVVVHIRA